MVMLVLKLFLKCLDSYTFPYSLVTLVLMFDVAPIKMQLAKMAQVIVMLTMTIEEKDSQIASLINKLRE